MGMPEWLPSPTWRFPRMPNPSDDLQMHVPTKILLWVEAARVNRLCHDVRRIGRRELAEDPIHGRESTIVSGSLRCKDVRVLAEKRRVRRRTRLGSNNAREDCGKRQRELSHATCRVFERHLCVHSSESVRGSSDSIRCRIEDKTRRQFIIRDEEVQLSRSCSCELNRINCNVLILNERGRGRRGQRRTCGLSKVQSDRCRGSTRVHVAWHRRSPESEIHIHCDRL